MIVVTAPLQVWTGADGISHFLRIPEGQSGEIRAQAMLVRRGFGSVKIEATVEDFTWRTSVFPAKESRGYFLPVKAEVLRRTGIAAGDDVTVTLEMV